MATEDEVRAASEKFYLALNHVLNGDAGPLADIWSYSATVTTMHPIGGREVGWELYNLKADFSQADNLAARETKRFDEMKALFLKERRTTSSQSARAFGCAFTRRTASRPRTRAGKPGLGRESNHVTIEAELGENASGVLYALRGASGGLTLYMDKGELVYEYNMMIIERYVGRSNTKLAAGKRRIEVDTTIARPGASAEVVLSVDGQEVVRTMVKRTVPAAFPASESFDVGVDLGSPVSLDYFDRRPFKFDGKIASVKVQLK